MLLYPIENPVSTCELCVSRHNPWELIQFSLTANRLLLFSLYNEGMEGILLVDKPVGWTSFDVVAKVRGCLRQQLKDDRPQLTAASPKLKVGHTGTLDPLATGLLVILIGSYTKRASEFSKLDKTYQVTMKLGETSTTGDAEGIITPLPNITYFKRSSEICNKLTGVLQTFVGEIEQVPPKYSAVKINGQRAYKLARAGKEVKLEPRKVRIHSITDVSVIRPVQLKSTIVHVSSIMPQVKFTTKVSSGTYIRTLAEDIGKALDVGAYLTDLRRTKVGEYNIEGALSTETLTSESIKTNLLTSKYHFDTILIL